MRSIILAGLLLLLPWRSSFAADDEFPARLRGIWANTSEACTAIAGQFGPAFAREDQKWLKISGSDVLGSAPGRFLRQVPAEMANGTPAGSSFEMQALDEPGTIVRLMLSADGRLHLTTGATTGRELGNYQRC